MIELFIKGGPLMWPILFCSVMALAITLFKSSQFYSLIKQLSQTPEMLLKKHPVHINEFLNAIKEKRNEKQVSLIGNKELNALEKGVGVLALIAAITPLMGLTGTVLGMIDSFRVIAVHGSGARIELLASGIWEALITTAAGLLVAIPVECAYHYLERRLNEIEVSMEELTVYFEIAGTE